MITFEQAINTDRFEHVSMKNSDKSPLRCRRNGKTKTWKRQPEKFQIPVKYGLYEYFYITNENAGEWNAAN